MKQYAKYKPSGFDWLGEIPEHWGLKRVKDVFLSIGSGSTPKSSMTELYDENGYYWVQSGDLNDGYVSDTKTKINDVALERTPALRLYPKDSLIVAMYGATIGKLGILTMDSYTNQACCVMSNPVQFNPLFLFYELCFFKPTMLSFATGGGQPNISQEDVKYHIFPYPPYPEQTAIVKYLDEKTSNIDRRIELLKQKIDKYKELRRSLISQVVTRGLNPNVKLKPSGIDWLGDIPEHWKLRRIKDVIKLINGRAYSQDELLYEGKYKVLRVGNFFTNESWYYSNLELEKEKYCHKNDLLYAWSASIGPYIWTEDNTIFHYHIWKVDLNNKFTLKYAYYLLLAVTKRKMFDMHGSAMVHLTMEDMNYTFIPFPNITEQTAIADYLDEKTSQIDTIVSNCEKQIEQLTELRRSLISQVVTGKIKVTD